VERTIGPWEGGGFKSAFLFRHFRNAVMSICNLSMCIFFSVVAITRAAIVPVVFKRQIADGSQSKLLEKVSQYSQFCNVR
jgi:hypothetical protein